MKLTYYPNPVLLNRCRELTEDELLSGKHDGQHFEVIFGEMRRMMKANNGCGLAAPQAGLPIRLFVAEHEEQRIEVINPVLHEMKGRTIEEEGCLSIPGIHAYVFRAQKLVLTGLDPKLNKIELKLSHWMARIVQHEFDHCEGVLFTDKMGCLDKDKHKDTLARMRSAWESSLAQAS